MADDPIATIYLADRTDGSAIYQAHMNLLYVITTYGALVAAAIGSNLITHRWALAFIGAPHRRRLTGQTGNGLRPSAPTLDDQPQRHDPDVS